MLESTPVKSHLSVVTVEKLFVKKAKWLSMNVSIQERNHINATFVGKLFLILLHSDDTNVGI
jgi:Ni,Fe-hydrogenase III component G